MHPSRLPLPHYNNPATPPPTRTTPRFVPSNASPTVSLQSGAPTTDMLGHRRVPSVEKTQLSWPPTQSIQGASQQTSGNIVQSGGNPPRPAFMQDCLARIGRHMRIPTNDELEGHSAVAEMYTALAYACIYARMPRPDLMWAEIADAMDQATAADISLPCTYPIVRDYLDRFNRSGPPQAQRIGRKGGLKAFSCGGPNTGNRPPSLDDVAKLQADGISRVELSLKVHKHFIRAEWLAREGYHPEIEKQVLKFREVAEAFGKPPDKIEGMCRSIYRTAWLSEANWGYISANKGLHDDLRRHVVNVKTFARKERAFKSQVQRRQPVVVTWQAFCA